MKKMMTMLIRTMLFISHIHWCKVSQPSSQRQDFLNLHRFFWVHCKPSRSNHFCELAAFHSQSQWWRFQHGLNKSLSAMPFHKSLDSRRLSVESSKNRNNFLAFSCALTESMLRGTQILLQLSKFRRCLSHSTQYLCIKFLPLQGQLNGSSMCQKDGQSVFRFNVFVISPLPEKMSPFQLRFKFRKATWGWQYSKALNW